MKRAILWCGQVERGPIVRSMPDAVRQSQKERRIADNRSESLFAHNDFTLQANGLELAFQAACHLGIEESEIYACLVQEDLCPQGLQTAVRRATPSDLEKLLFEIGECSGHGDALLFVAVNHGSSRGLTTAEDVSDPMREDAETILTPEQLDYLLQPMTGPQVLVIVTCFAGAFLVLGNENRCVLTACAANERYFVPRCDNLRSPFLEELFGAWCAHSHDDAIPRVNLPLDKAFERAKERMSLVQGLSVPCAAGVATWPASGAHLMHGQKLRKSPLE